MQHRCYHFIRRNSEVQDRMKTMVSLFGFGSKDKEEKKPGFLDRLKQAVASTKAQLVEKIEEIVEGKATLDESVSNSRRP